MQQDNLNKLSHNLSYRERQQLYSKIYQYQQESSSEDDRNPTVHNYQQRESLSPLTIDFNNSSFLFKLYLTLVGLLKSISPEQMLFRLRFKKLESLLRTGTDPILFRQGSNFYITSIFAQWLYSIYSQLLALPFEKKIFSLADPSLLSYFFSTLKQEDFRRNITDFCTSSDLESYAQNFLSKKSHWEELKTKISFYFDSNSAKITHEFVLRFACIFQINNMRSFPFHAFFALFGVIEFTTDAKLRFHPALINSTSRKLLSELFLLMEGLGKLYLLGGEDIAFFLSEETSNNTKPTIASNLLLRELNKLSINWSKLLEQQQVWGLVRYLTKNYYLETPIPKFQFSNYCDKVNTLLKDVYIEELEQQFDKTLQLGYERHLESLEQKYLPKISHPIHFYNNTFSYSSCTEKQFSVAIKNLSRRNVKPIFKHQRELELLINFCSDWLNSYLHGFFERLLHLVLDSQPTMRASGAKILSSAYNIVRIIHAVDNSLAPKSSKGQKLKELREKIVHGNKKALQDLYRFTTEMDIEVETVIETSILVLERLEGFSKTIIQSYYDLNLKDDLSRVIAHVDKTRPPLELLKSMNKGVKDFLYLREHRTKIKKK